VAPEPEVTAVVISHNHAAFILECLESVNSQTIKPARVVLVDDGSSDDSFARGAEYVERHFPDHVLIDHPTPVGLCRSLNEALTQSRGDYLQEIAADDYWLPDKTEQQLQIFAAADQRTAVVFGDAVLIGPDGVPSGETFLGHFAPKGPPPLEDLFKALLRRNFLPGMSAMIRRAALLEVGGWDESLLYEDWDMWLRLSERWPIVVHDEPVAAYRYLPTSLSNSAADEMWLSKLTISTRWAGQSLRADVGALVHGVTPTIRRAGRGDFRLVRQWWKLLGSTVSRRVLRRGRVRQT
jgi:cellulose synthase/poly-beta-1,6-N-acetylglucosamine synthase-like glycosyltransferase